MHSHGESPIDRPDTPVCVLDETVVNEKTLHEMSDMGMSFFATLCGMNRGAFVLDPSDGKTYGCTDFPLQFPTLAGVPNVHRNMTLILPTNITKEQYDEYNVTAPEYNETYPDPGYITINAPVQVPYTLVLKDANAIKETYQMGNVTAAETLKFLNYFIKMVYHSTGGKDTDPYACNVGGLATLQCEPVNAIATLRGATLAGLYVPALWATGGKELTVKEQDRFYNRQDFDDMRGIGLNTVQIPVPIEAFGKDDDDNIKNRLHYLLQDIRDAGLQAILVLVGHDNDNYVTSAARYAIDHGSVVFGMMLPSRQSYGAARAVNDSIRLFIPIQQSDLPSLQMPNDENTFAALDMSHTSSIGDVASSAPKDDRMKLYYHESLACIQRSPLEFAQCYKRTPVYVYAGFDLAIDDCITRNSNEFVDYGQCDRLNETIGSSWWHRHRKSFAERQLFSYEHGLGWSFAAWKLYDEGKPTGFIEKTAQLLALRDVTEAGLMPSLKKPSKYHGACLNPPVSDFELGDRTLSPTPGPPPDCGNGWWNFETLQCDYWIPPETKVPSEGPTWAPTELPTPVLPDTSYTRSATTLQLGLAAGSGAIAALFLGALVKKWMSSKRSTYQEVPNFAV
jgi:hypothetical protein